MIKLKRIDDEYWASDGFRIFVDPLWARGMKKENTHIDGWVDECEIDAMMKRSNVEIGVSL